MPKQILLYDADPVYGTIIERKLSASHAFIFLGRFENRDAFLSTIRKRKPDIVLLEVAEDEGLDMIRDIRLNFPTTSIVILSRHEDPLSIRKALKAGAHGYLLKSLNSVDLVDDLNRFASTGVALSPTIARTLVKGFWMASSSPLTKTETQVLRYITLGYSRSRLASSMGISTETVRSHMKNIYRKLNVHRKSEVVFKARSEQLIN